MPATLMGGETEYAVAARDPDGQALPTEQTVSRLMSVAARRPVAAKQRRSPSGSTFLQSGGRYYVDAGAHPEVTTPECAGPTDYVRYINAGEAFLVSVADEMRQTFADVADVSVFRCNVDYATGFSTWGCHESYLYRANPESLPRELIPHFVSRLIYSGAGGFDSLHPGLRFTLSPRSHHLSGEISRESQSGRSIFHTKNEALARPGFHRLHVICGESVCSHKSAWLKAATTALILALIDAGKHPGLRVSLQDPLNAMWSFSLDPTCAQRVKLYDGRLVTAIDIQRHYLDTVRSHLGAAFMPPWADEACALWQSTLDALARDPLSLSRTLDWPMKFALFTDSLKERGLTWDTANAWNDVLERALAATRREPAAWDALKPEVFASGSDARLRALVDPLVTERSLNWDQYPDYWQAIGQLKEADLRFGQLGPDGLFNRIDAQPGLLNHRIVDRDAVLAAVDEPPAAGRAHVRGTLIRDLVQSGRLFACDWQGVWDLTNRRFADLSDPFATSAQWQDAPADVPEGDIGLVSILRARQERRPAPEPRREVPVPVVTVRLREASRHLRGRTDGRSRQFRNLARRIQASPTVAVDTARQLNNLALDFRNEGELDAAELLLRAALDIERDFYEPTHPKLPHRINNLASVMLLKDHLAEADDLTREAWTLKTGRHDITSARILCLRIILAYVAGDSAAVYVGQIKTLLDSQDGLRNDGDVTPEWNFANPLASLRARLDPDQWTFAQCLVSTLNNPWCRDPIRQLPAWVETPAFPLNHPWPDAVAHAEESPF